MLNLLKLGVASQKTFTMQESFQINKYISTEKMKEWKKERKKERKKEKKRKEKKEKKRKENKKVK